MSSEWKEFVLGQSCTKIGSGATPTGGKETYLSKGEIALIRSQNVLDFEFSLDGLAYINQDQAKKLNNVELVKDDVLINITGDSVARVCKVPDDLLPARVNQHVAILRTDKGKLDSEFLKYSLLLPSNKSLLLAIASAGATRNALTKVMLETFTIRAPKDVATQSKVANVLKQLDLKIAINNKINQTLETIAQTLFKSWFVDFDPVKAKIAAKEQGQDPQLAAMLAVSGKTAEQIAQLAADKRNELAATADLFPDETMESELGMIPRGWTINTIEDVCSFQNGYAFKSEDLSRDSDNFYKVFKMGNIKKGGGFNLDGSKDYYPIDKSQNLSKYEIYKGDLLMCMTDMKNNVALLGHTAIMPFNRNYLLNQRVGLLRTNNKKIVDFPFLFQLTNDEHFIKDLRSRANSGVQVNLSTSEIKKSKFVLPSIDIHKIFNNAVSKMYEKMFSVEAENISLSSLRDTLLPKLLSGEIEIKQ